MGGLGLQIHVRYFYLQRTAYESVYERLSLRWSFFVGLGFVPLSDPPWTGPDHHPGGPERKPADYAVGVLLVCHENIFDFGNICGGWSIAKIRYNTNFHFQSIYIIILNRPTHCMKPRPIPIYCIWLLRAISPVIKTQV